MRRRACWGIASRERPINWYYFTPRSRSVACLIVSNTLAATAGWGQKEPHQRPKWSGQMVVL